MNSQTNVKNKWSNFRSNCKKNNKSFDKNKSYRIRVAHILFIKLQCSTRENKDLVLHKLYLNKSRGQKKLPLTWLIFKHFLTSVSRKECHRQLAHHCIATQDAYSDHKVWVLFYSIGYSPAFSELIWAVNGMKWLISQIEMTVKQSEDLLLWSARRATAVTTAGTIAANVPRRVENLLLLKKWFRWLLLQKFPSSRLA